MHSGLMYLQHQGYETSVSSLIQKTGEEQEVGGGRGGGINFAISELVGQHVSTILPLLLFILEMFCPNCLSLIRQIV